MATSKKKAEKAEVMEEQTISTASNQLQVSRQNGLIGLNTLEVSDISKLQNAEAAPIDLMSDYWTPESPGEFKRVLFDRFDLSYVLAQDTGDVIELECAYFFVQENGVVKSIRNGSKRLVGALQAVSPKRGTPLEIRYMGKKQNRMNQFKSDNWSVKPLVINLQNS